MSGAGSEFETVQKIVIDFVQTPAGLEKFAMGVSRSNIGIIPLYRAGVKRTVNWYWHHGYLQVMSTNLKLNG